MYLHGACNVPRLRGGVRVCAEFVVAALRQIVEALLVRNGAHRVSFLLIFPVRRKFALSPDIVRVHQVLSGVLVHLVELFRNGEFSEVPAGTVCERAEAGLYLVSAELRHHRLAVFVSRDLSRFRLDPDADRRLLLCIDDRRIELPVLCHEHLIPDKRLFGRFGVHGEPNARIAEFVSLAGLGFVAPHSFKKFRSAFGSFPVPAAGAVVS